MVPVVDADDPVIVALGDSAMWTTGTRYEDKTPNLVHEALKDEPIPPARFRARGGAVIGASPPAPERLGGGRERYEPPRGYYDFKEDNADWYSFYTPDDRSDINQLRWTLARDIGSAYPTVLQQIEQFPPLSELPYGASERQKDEWRVDVPERAVRQLPGSGAPDDLPPRAEEADLVLVNGGTNDIDLSWLMDYREKNRLRMIKAIEHYSLQDTATMLDLARDRFPNAVIALVGYFPFLSDWTDYDIARAFLLRMLGGFEGSFAAIERAIDHAMTFARAHVHYMRTAAAFQMREDMENGAPGTVFVSRGFGTVHSFASTATDPWCWGQYDDDTFFERLHACQHIVASDDYIPVLDENPSADVFDDIPIDRSDWVGCKSAAVGHPNRTGSRKTAEAIVDRWERYVEQSTKTTIEELSERTPLSVSDEIERHGLETHIDQIRQEGKGPSGIPEKGSSLRYALTHRTVDSIKLEFHRANELNDDLSGFGRNPYLLDKAMIYLEVSPGRSGSGDRFRVDWEDADGLRVKDTPQFDKHSDGRGWQGDTEVYVDPMLGRDMDGDVGAHDEGVAAGDDDPDRNHPSSNSWDDERLRLGDVQSARLIIENPSRWALVGVTLTINGDIEYRADVDQVSNRDRVVIDGLLDNDYTSPPPEPPRERGTPPAPNTPERTDSDDDASGGDADGESVEAPGFGVGPALGAVAGSAVLVKWLLEDDGD